MDKISEKINKIEQEMDRLPIFSDQYAVLDIERWLLINLHAEYFK